MDLSKDLQLKMKIDELKKETGLNDQEIKKLFVNTYLLKDTEDDPDQILMDLLNR